MSTIDTSGIDPAVPTADAPLVSAPLRGNFAKIKEALDAAKSDIGELESAFDGLGTAAAMPASDFATAVQGGKADTAVQPGTSPSLRGVTIARPAGEDGYYSFLTSGGGAGVGRRWIVGVDSVAEEGNNTGSNFWVARYGDSGGWLDSPIIVSRYDGRVLLWHPPKLPSYTVATLPSPGVMGAGIAHVSNGAGNKRLAVSDGTNWRWPDGGIVS